MAKLTALEILNEVLQNAGLPTVSALTALTGIQNVAWDAINEVIQDLGTSDHWKTLEASGAITLGSNTSTYSTATDQADVDYESFRYNQTKKLPYRTPQEFDRQYLTQTSTGTPNVITEFGGYWRPYYIPDVAAHGKIISYRYWSKPTLLTTATSTGTCWIPETYDRTVLVNLATYRVLHYRGHPEAQVYYQKVYGGQNEEGSIVKFKRIHRSPSLTRLPVTEWF